MLSVGPSSIMLISKDIDNMLQDYMKGHV